MVLKKPTVQCACKVLPKDRKRRIFFFFTKLKKQKNRKIARLTDIRIVTPIKIAVKDVTQIDLLRRELETKKYTISEYQKSLELARLSLQMRKRELERAQSILEEREMDTEKNVILTRSE